MVAIITGDIINSTEDESAEWLSLLKQVLNRYGTSPEDWEIFRGDSFQLKTKPQQALQTAFHIKACIKQTGSRDVRMAIGVGETSIAQKRISESNGSAFVRSGERFEELKKQTLAIRTDNERFDEMINLMLDLALLTANNWSAAVATIIHAAIEHSDKPQKELAKMLDKSQSNISEAMSRGGYHEMMRLNEFYTKRIADL
jgi:hypothetical protein